MMKNNSLHPKKEIEKKKNKTKKNNKPSLFVFCNFILLKYPKSFIFLNKTNLGLLPSSSHFILWSLEQLGMDLSRLFG